MISPPFLAAGEAGGGKSIAHGARPAARVPRAISQRGPWWFAWSGSRGCCVKTESVAGLECFWGYRDKRSSQKTALFASVCRHFPYVKLNAAFPALSLAIKPAIKLINLTRTFPDGFPDQLNSHPRTLSY